MYEAIQEQLKACVDYLAEQGHLKPGAAVEPAPSSRFGVGR